MTIMHLPQLRYVPIAAQDFSDACTFLHERHCNFYSRHLPKALLNNNTRETFMRHLERRSSSTWLARQGKRIVGLVIVTANCIDDLWVDERYQRRGLGRRLLAIAVDYIRGNGYSAAQAGVEDFNLAARAFYERLGWRIIGTEHLSLDRNNHVEALVYSVIVAQRANA